MTYMYASDLQSFSSSVADSANSSFLQPTGKYSLNVWVQVQCKAATAFPQGESIRVEARVVSCSQLRNAMLYIPIDQASKMCFQTTTVPISGFLVSLKVMYWRVESARETWIGREGNKTIRKFDDVRSSIDDWRSTIGDCGERRPPGRQIWRHTDLKRERY